MTCPFLHDVVEVGVQLLHHARDLRADVDGRHRLERAGRRHHVDDVAAGDLQGRHCRLGPACRACSSAAPPPTNRQDDENRDQLFHDRVAVLRVLREPRTQSFPAFFENRVDRRHEHQRDQRRGRQPADDHARERRLQLRALADGRAPSARGRGWSSASSSRSGGGACVRLSPPLRAAACRRAGAGCWCSRRAGSHYLRRCRPT